MRRFAPAVAVVVSALTLTAGPALADSGPGRAEHAGDQASTTSDHHRAEHRHHHDAKPRRVRSIVTMTGVISDTPTATIGATSDTATSTISIAVKGGDRALHGTTVTVTLDRFTVVRRGDGAAAAADLQMGDHVSVRARRMPDGSWLGLRVNASGREPEHTGSD